MGARLQLVVDKRRDVHVDLVDARLLQHRGRRGLVQHRDDLARGAPVPLQACFLSTSPKWLSSSSISHNCLFGGRNIDPT